MNNDADMEEEPLITFENVNKEFLKNLYNLLTSGPDTEMRLATAGSKTCFGISKLYPDDCGAFGFVVPFMQMIFIATAMVFEYVASTNSWEQPTCYLENAKELEHKDFWEWESFLA
jgi:hypothetical protein